MPAVYYLRGLKAFNVLAALATGGLGVSGLEPASGLPYPIPGPPVCRGATAGLCRGAAEGLYCLRGRSMCSYGVACTFVRSRHPVCAVVPPLLRNQDQNVCVCVWVGGWVGGWGGWRHIIEEGLYVCVCVCVWVLCLLLHGFFQVEQDCQAW